MVSARNGRPKRVVVAGTGFGRIYLQAIASAPDHFVLAGVLARGSDYSCRWAREAGVPLYTTVADVPGDVDIACVVLRSGATGGPGSDVARQFLLRGTHVLQEHPVHAAEITACLKAARDGNAAYAVNTLYPNIRAVRQFLAAAACLRESLALRAIDAVCNSQVAYPLLDVLGQAAGGLRPWVFDAPAPLPARTAADPFTSLTASIGGVPVTLRVQNEVHPEDADNHSLLMHRISLGTDAGMLTLADTHGPVLWNPRLHSPRDSTGRLLMHGPGTERLDVPSTVVLGDTAMRSYHQVFARTWPDAVAEALHGLCRDIHEPARRRAAGLWALDVSQAWREMNARIGMPRLIRPPTPPVQPLPPLHAAVAAVDRSSREGATA